MIHGRPDNYLSETLRHMNQLFSGQSVWKQYILSNTSVDFHFQLQYAEHSKITAIRKAFLTIRFTYAFSIILDTDAKFIVVAQVSNSAYIILLYHE